MNLTYSAAKEGLVNLIEDMAQHSRCYPQLYGPHGVRMEEKSRSKLLPQPGFEPQTWQSCMQPLTTMNPGILVEQFSLAHGHRMMWGFTGLNETHFKLIIRCS